MTDRRAALAAAVVAVVALVGCSGGSAPTPVASGGIFDPSAESSLPPIATDDCPDTSTAAAVGSGDRLPALVLDCIGSDRRVDLRSLTGTPTVLNVWASWCLPCKAEMPLFQEVNAAAAGRVRFLGLNVADDERNARARIQDTGITYPSVRSEGRELLNALRVPGPPVTLFVDAAGRLVHREVGELTAQDLRDLIAAHLEVVVPAGP